MKLNDLVLSNVDICHMDTGVGCL